jgi:D-alanine-D-alanine ligase
MRDKLRIAVAYNLKREPGPGLPKDYFAEYDDISVPNSIREALEKKGYYSELVEADENFFSKVRGNYDFVFNIAEGINVGSRESQVPAILDMLGIPYTGSGVLTQAITLDKRRTKEILAYHNVPTARFQVFTSPNQKMNPELVFPLFVKPNSEGSSKGITNDALVFDEAGLKKRLSYVIKTYQQPAIVEEFLEGREFTVSIIGNNPPRVLPIVEVTFDYLPAHINKFDSYDVKWFWDSPNNPVDPVVCPAKLTRYLERMIKSVALRTYEVLGCVDLCRIDMRLDKTGLPHVIEVNALPGLMPDPLENSRFPKSCYVSGMKYEDIILTVLHEAMKRHGMITEIKVKDSRSVLQV